MQSPVAKSSQRCVVHEPAEKAAVVSQCAPMPTDANGGIPDAFNRQSSGKSNGKSRNGLHTTFSHRAYSSERPWGLGANKRPEEQSRQKSARRTSWQTLYSPDWDTDETNVDSVVTDVVNSQGALGGEDIAGYQSTGLSLAGYPSDFLMNRPSIVTQLMGSMGNRGVDTFGILVDVYNKGLVASPRMNFVDGPGTLRF